MPLQHSTPFVRLFALALVVATLSITTSFAQWPTFARTDYPSLGNNHVVGRFFAFLRVFESSWLVLLVVRLDTRFFVVLVPA
jgi:hypothetical protein